MGSLKYEIADELASAPHGRPFDLQNAANRWPHRRTAGQMVKKMVELPKADGRNYLR